jgi:excisionase family DNA binding protein
MSTNQAIQAPAATMTAQDVANELRISRSKAYEIMRSRGFVSYRIGVKRIICYRSDFEAWLSRQQQK